MDWILTTASACMVPHRPVSQTSRGTLCGSRRRYDTYHSTWAIRRSVQVSIGEVNIQSRSTQYHFEILQQRLPSSFLGRIGSPGFGNADGSSLHTEELLHYGDELLRHGFLVSVRLWKKVQRIEQAFWKLEMLNTKTHGRVKYLPGTSQEHPRWR